MRKLPFYFEPWRAWRDTTWDLAFRNGPPRIDDEEAVGKWWSARDRAERDAKVVLFGSGARAAAVCTAMTTGEPVVDPGEAIVATLTPIHHDHPKGADHVQVGDRVVACVNAMAGIPDPVGTMAIVRSLLWELHKGYTDADDVRLVKLLDRLGPTEDYIKLQKRVFATEE